MAEKESSEEGEEDAKDKLACFVCTKRFGAKTPDAVKIEDLNKNPSVNGYCSLIMIFHLLSFISHNFF